MVPFSLIGREWLCDRAPQAQGRLAPDPILQVGGGGAGGKEGQGLGPQELRPRRPGPAGRRPQAAPAQHVAMAVAVAEIVILSVRSSPLILR